MGNSEEALELVDFNEIFSSDVAEYLDASSFGELVRFSRLQPLLTREARDHLGTVEIASRLITPHVLILGYLRGETRGSNIGVWYRMQTDNNRQEQFQVYPNHNRDYITMVYKNTAADSPTNITMAASLPKHSPCSSLGALYARTDKEKDVVTIHNRDPEDQQRYFDIVRNLIAKMIQMSSKY